MQQHITGGSVEERIIYEKQKQANLGGNQVLRDTDLANEQKPGFFDKMKAKIHDKFSSHAGETDVIRDNIMRDEGIHTESGMPINTGLHTGAALNDKTRLKDTSSLASGLMGQGEFSKEALLNQQRLQGNTGWEQNIIHGTTGIGQTPLNTLGSGMGAPFSGTGLGGISNQLGGITEGIAHHGIPSGTGGHMSGTTLQSSYQGLQGCMCQGRGMMGETNQGFSSLANQPHLMSGTVNQGMNLNSNICPLHHQGISTGGLVTDSFNQFSGQVQQPTANFGTSGLMGQGELLGQGGAPIIHQQVAKPTLYHGADFNEPLGSKKLAQDLHDVKAVSNTMPIRHDYDNLPSTDLNKNLGGMYAGGTQLQGTGLGSGLTGQNMQVCSTCRGIGKNLCGHCDHMTNPELAHGLHQTAEFNKECVTSMPQQDINRNIIH